MGPELRQVVQTIMSDLGMGEDQSKIDALEQYLEENLSTFFSMHDFNRLMSAMSIDGIWQNNLIYFEIRQNAASLFGIRIRIQGG